MKPSGFSLGFLIFLTSSTLWSKSQKLVFIQKFFLLILERKHFPKGIRIKPQLPIMTKRLKTYLKSDCNAIDKEN